MRSFGIRSIERSVQTPKEVLELRAAYESIVRVSIFPLEEQLEVRSPLLKGRRYDVSAGYTRSVGRDRSLFLLAFTLRF